MSLVVARFIMLFDPIINWVKQGKDAMRVYILWLAFFVALFVLCLASAPDWNARVPTVLDVIGGIGAILCGICIFVTIILITMEFFLEGYWEKVWKKTGNNFADEVKKNISAEKAKLEQEKSFKTVSAPTPQQEDIEYLR